MPKVAQQNLLVFVKVEPDGPRRYHAYAPALKGLHADGRTKAQALENARKAIGVYLDSLLRNGEKLPIGPYLRVEPIKMEPSHVPEVPVEAFLYSIQWPSHHMSGSR